MKDLWSRRTLVRHLALAAGAAAVLPTARSGAAAAAPAPAPAPLDLKDPAAVAMGYVSDTAQIDPNKDPTYVSGNSCSNCLQLQGKVGDAYRPCTLFPGKLVNVNGWCKGWTPEI